MRLRRITTVSLICVALASASRVTQAIDIGTSAAFHQQRFEAWGTSLAWMGNELGGSSNTFRRDQIMDLLFDQNNGLGLNFVRYNIGADQNPAGPAITRPGAAMEGWVPDAPSNVANPNTWVWDWNADSTQRWVLDAAIARGVTQVEAFANSAPWWMTIAQSSTGNPAGGANLETDHYDEFTHYLLEVSEHFRTNLGIQFNSLAPMNEPGAGWWTGGNRQEGMNVPQGSRQSSLIREVGMEIAGRGLDIHLVGPEETSTDQTLDSWNFYGSTTKSYISQVNTHTYPFNGGSGASDSAALLSAVEADGKKIYATEYGTGSASQPVSGGIRLANQIRTDLRNLKAAGWTYWQAVEDNNGSNWGLLIAPFDGNNNWFNMRRQYYAMQQFTSYIRPGAQVLDQPIQEVVAAYDPRTDATTLVVTNDETTTDQRDFDLLDQIANYTRVIRTSDTENFKSLGPASVAGNQVSISAPGNSITTLVVYHQPNLIQNGEFSLGANPNGATQIPGWQVQGGAFFNINNHSSIQSGSGALYTNSQGNSGDAFQSGIGDPDVDLTGVAFEFSIDVRFQNEGSAFYDADTYLALEFYGADDQTLTHATGADFETLIIPALEIDETVGMDSDYRTFRTDRFVAPPGTRYVRPVIRYDNVDSDSTNAVFFDNAYLGEAHPGADAREWTAEGGGDLANNANWLNHALVENNSRLYFGNAIKQDSTITLDDSEAATGLTYFSEHEYQLQGTGSLTIGNPSETALVDVRYGSHQISVDTSLAGDLNLQALAGASISFDFALDLDGRTVTKMGAGDVGFAAGFEMNGGRIASYATEESAIFLGTDAILDGDFELLLAPGQQLQLGDLFEVVFYASLNDPFDNLILPAIDNAWAWEVDYGPNALTLEIVDAGIPGDFDGSGEVDGRDLLDWQRNGLSAVELDEWQSSYGANGQNSPLTAVPEPTWLSLLLGIAFCAFDRGRR